MCVDGNCQNQDHQEWNAINVTINVQWNNKFIVILYIWGDYAELILE